MSINENFNKPIHEIIQNRISVRSYESRDIPVQIIKEIENFSASISGLFNGQIRIKIVHVPTLQKDVELKLGTYGVIRGTNYFIAAAHEKGKLNLVNAGYILEQIVLFATSLGLGTCWLAGTFNRSAFSQAMQLQTGEVLPVIIALGYPQVQKLHLIDSVFRTFAKSRTRKPWDQIFFDEDFETPLAQSGAGLYANAFEMLRWAPSASNKQPWRILKKGNEFHFYIYRPLPKNKKIPFSNLPFLDLGIGLSHFELSANELGLKGEWQIKKPQVELLPEQLTYVVSWSF